MPQPTPLIGGLLPALLMGPANPVIQPLLAQFKQELQSRYPAQAGLQNALAQLEQRPESQVWQEAFREEAQRTQADHDLLLQDIVRQLLEVVKNQPTSTTVTATGGSAAAIGQGNVVVASRGVHVGGNVGGSIITGDSSQGGITARTIKADNVVQGIQQLGSDRADASGLVKLAEALRQGRITADSIEARNVVAGFQYIADPTHTTPDELRQEVAALKRQLAEALAASGLEATAELADAQEALAKAETELAQVEPQGKRVVRQLKTAAEILTEGTNVTDAARKTVLALVKLAPVAAALYQIATTLLGG